MSYETLLCTPFIRNIVSILDSAQYGNRMHTSIQHYLIRMIHRIQTSLDKNSKGEVNAVLCMFIDWKQAYSRQCHTLGMESFLKNGVRPSIIPLLISYFQDRQMRVKFFLFFFIFKEFISEYIPPTLPPSCGMLWGVKIMYMNQI
jgi:hypothetical protein